MTSPRPSPRPRPRPDVAAPTHERTLGPTRSGSLPRALAAVPRALAHTARDTTRAARAPRPSSASSAPARRRRWEPPIDPASWSGALIVMVAVTAALWVVQILDATLDLDLRRFGIVARHGSGLRGIVLAPFIHDGYGHMLSNTVPLIGIGWVVLLAGLRVWALVTAVVVLLGGALTWLVAPGHVLIVGASGVVFGWLGYLLARAVFSRSLKWIVVAGLTLGFFSTLLTKLFPTLNSSDVSWQAHVCGFVAGIAVGAVLHPRGTELRRFRRTAVS